MATVEVHGHEARQGDTQFAFCALRLREPLDREGLLAVVRYVAPLIPDADAFIEGLGADGDWPDELFAVPWSPPEAGHAVDAQRRLIDTAGPVGVAKAWFFQTGTGLPSDDDDDGDDEDEDDDAVDEDLKTEVAGTALPEETRDDDVNPLVDSG